MSNPLFAFRKLKWQQYFRDWVTPREFKRGARDIPFGLGAQSLYVDGVNGNDHNDGESWKTAKKTIQAVVDDAESWTQIFIKPDTYAENVVIPSTKRAIKLIGTDRGSVIIKPASGTAVKSSSENCRFENFTAIGNGVTEAGLDIYTNNSVLNVQVGNQDSTGYGLITGSYAMIEKVITHSFFEYRPGYGIIVRGSVGGEIKNCIIQYADTGIKGSNEECAEWKIHDNIIEGYSSYGTDFPTFTDANIIYHNNFLGGGIDHVRDSGSGNVWRENYYNEHSNIDNGFGIATEPYSFTSGQDPRPVVVPNGWLFLSWADADLVAQASVCTEARLAELDAANIPSDLDTLLARLTAVRAGYLDELDFDLDARLGTPAVSIAADIADLITRSKGLDDIHDDLFTADGVVDSILGNQKKYWHWNAISGDYHAIVGTWGLVARSSQHLGVVLENSSNAFLDEIRIPIFFPSTDSLVLNIRCFKCSSGGVATFYLDGSDVGSINFYSSSNSFNQIEELSLSPPHSGLNAFAVCVTDTTGGQYLVSFSELWFS